MQIVVFRLMVGLMVFGWFHGVDIGKCLTMCHGWMQQNPIMGTLVNDVGLLVYLK